MDSATGSATETGSARVAALLNPASVAIVGARENPSGWTARINANLQRFGFAGPVWPVNPSRQEMWGGPCYPDVASLPGKPDHLVVMLQAAAVADCLRAGAAAGARSATVYAVGFGESGTDAGRRREDELRAVVAETGIALSGPNCLGNLSAPGRLLTVPDDRVRALNPGPVAIVGQSGTTTTGIARVLMARGMDPAFAVTSGNETGLITADYLDYFVDAPEVKVIFCLVEAVRSPDRFLAACRRADAAGKPVVALKMGVSEAGRAATLAHTGALAGAIQAFDAVAGAAGVIRVESADQTVNVLEFLVHAPLPKKPGVALVCYSGSVRGLTIDAGERHGVPLPAFAPETVRQLKELLPDEAEARLGNPIDAASYLNRPPEVQAQVIAALAADPAVGTVLFQEDVPPDEGHNEANRRRNRRVLATLETVDRSLPEDGTPVGMVSSISYDLTDFGRAARARFPHFPLLNEPDRALRALAAVNGYVARRAAAADRPPAVPVPPLARALRDRAPPATAQALDETESKALVAEYGIRLPREERAASADAAVQAARAIGFPVVMKGVCAALAHKSDAGAVMLDLGDEAAVRRAWDDIHRNVAAYDAALALDGVLVAEQVTGGLELVIGIGRDPEMGPVVMFGLGGVWLELFRDVAFGPPGLGQAEAARMVNATRAGRLIAGYRGAGPYDRAAVLDAIVAAGRIAHDLGTTLDALDINPFVALADGRGGVALDALAVLRGRG
jgi:acetyltransferase